MRSSTRTTTTPITANGAPLDWWRVRRRQTAAVWCRASENLSPGCGQYEDACAPVLDTSAPEVLGWGPERAINGRFRHGRGDARAGAGRCSCRSPPDLVHRMLAADGAVAGVATKAGRSGPTMLASFQPPASWTAWVGGHAGGELAGESHAAAVRSPIVGARH